MCLITYEVMIIKLELKNYFLKYQNKTETNSRRTNQTLESFEFQTEQNRTIIIIKIRIRRNSLNRTPFSTFYSQDSTN